MPAHEAAFLAALIFLAALALGVRAWSTMTASGALPYRTPTMGEEMTR